MGGFENFEFLDMICLFASAAVIVMGVIEMRRGELVGRKNDIEYTEESVRKLARIEGPLYIGVGFMGILTSLAGGLKVLPQVLFWPFLIIALVLIAADAFLIKKILVPKNKFQNIDMKKKLK